MSVGMDAHLADQARYYERRLAACRRRPALHRAQIAALEAHLALVRRAGDAARFSAALAHGGHATALGRAHQLDRFAADLAISRALGDGAAASAEAEAMAILAPPGDAAFAAAAIDVARATSRAMLEGVVGEHASRVVEAAIDFACDPDPARRDEAQRRARVAWATARAIVPGFGLIRLMAPPYRHRLPFADRAGAVLRELIGAAIGEAADLDGAAAPPLAGPPPPADFEAIAALALDGWPEVAPDPAAVAAELAATTALPSRASGLEQIAALRRAAEGWDEPALVRLADEALAGLAAASTDTEAQTWVKWHGEVSRIERAWWSMLVHAALWPVTAVLIDPGRARPAAVVAARLFGVDAAAPLAAPFLQRVLARQVVGAGMSFDDRPIAGPGAGHVELIRRSSGEHAVAVIEEAAARGAPIPDFAAVPPRFTDVASLVAHTAAALTAAGAPRGGDGSVVLWGHAVALGAVDAELARVPRPRPEGL